MSIDGQTHTHTHTSRRCHRVNEWPGQDGLGLICAQISDNCLGVEVAFGWLVVRFANKFNLQQARNSHTMVKRCSDDCTASRTLSQRAGCRPRHTAERDALDHENVLLSGPKIVTAVSQDRLFKEGMALWVKTRSWPTTCHKCATPQ